MSKGRADADVLQGRLDLMVFQTLTTLGRRGDRTLSLIHELLSNRS
jgi:hypothetical protein